MLFTVVRMYRYYLGGVVLYNRTIFISYKKNILFCLFLFTVLKLSEEIFEGSGRRCRWVEGKCRRNCREGEHIGGSCVRNGRKREIVGRRCESGGWGGVEIIVEVYESMGGGCT